MINAKVYTGDEKALEAEYNDGNTSLEIHSLWQSFKLIPVGLKLVSFYYRYPELWESGREHTLNIKYSPLKDFLE
ncbi:MAG: hypothetical protein SVV03_01965 [Candidatus Nanohaloarchaea archaeon]|nr:hypothetical protein [Candidatus Nanohaloarchaea archaeon]